MFTAALFITVKDCKQHKYSSTIKRNEEKLNICSTQQGG
jgi:hypothetical protein